MTYLLDSVTFVYENTEYAVYVTNPHGYTVFPKSDENTIGPEGITFEWLEEALMHADGVDLYEDLTPAAQTAHQTLIQMVHQNAFIPATDYPVKR